MIIKLRPYQEQAMNAVIAKKNTGTVKQLVELPTGSGKTVVFCELIKRHFPDKNVLILAHRDELIEQAKEKLEMVFGNAENIAVFTGSKKELGKQITVASVQTIKNYLNENTFMPEHFDLIICDEAHHATAETYLKVFDYFKKALLIGFTATPKRQDERKLGNLFEEIVFRKSISEMIQEGWLCKPVAISINTNIDISNITSTAGDFNQKQLEENLNNEIRNNAIIDTYKKLCPDEKAIVFCINKKHSQVVASSFIKAGISASFIDADTPRDSRKQILKDFSKGKIKVLCNCAVLTEGFDEPSIKAVFLARPTKSESLYTQMLGRGLRLHPDKDFCKVIDIVDATGKHKLKTADSILERTSKGFTIEEIKEKSEKAEKQELEQEWQEAEIYHEKIKGIELKLKTTSLFGKGRKFTWLGTGNYRFIDVGLDKVEIKQVNEEESLFQIFINHKPYLENPCTFEWAFGLAETYLNENITKQDRLLISQTARWRKGDISIKQMDLLNHKLKISNSDLNYLTKGEASEIIGNLLNKTIPKKALVKSVQNLINERKQLIA